MKLRKRPTRSFPAPEAANVDFGAPAGPTVFGARPKPVKEPSNWPIYLVALVVTVLWAAAPIAYAVGYRKDVSPLQYDPFALAVFAGLAIGPMALVWLCAYTLTQGTRLAAEVRRSRELANQMLAPAALAASEAGTVVEAVRRQIDDAEAAAGRTRETMASLREALDQETGRLNEAATGSRQTASELAETLAAQRRELQSLSAALQEQAATVSDAISRAGNVNAAAGEVISAARGAGEDMVRHTARLETTAAGVTEQMRGVEHGLTEQRTSLTALADNLHAEQEALKLEADARIARLTELVAQSKNATAEVSETAQQGAEAIQHLTAAAAERFNEITTAAARERDALAEALRASIDQITAAADNARRAAEEQTEAARTRVDQLNEAAFEAGRKADAVFEGRVTEARGLIEQSAAMIDEAGQKARERLEGWVAAARAAVTDIDQSLTEMTASARKTSEETKALDAAFQERVRANYELLSEAVRLMGVVAGPGLPPPSAAPEKPVSPPEPKPAPKAELRPRLRLTPAATDEEFHEALEAAADKTAAEPPPPAPEEEGLGWKGLLQSLDREGSDPEHLAERIHSELQAMGIDPAALLPKPKIEEIAAAVQTSDLEGAREVVRALAPAAVLRLARRLFADAALRGQAERFRKRFSATLTDASERDSQGFVVGSLLDSAEGRAWLLLDSAFADRR
jgi:chromosome segregation ATPase